MVLANRKSREKNPWATFGRGGQHRNMVKFQQFGGNKVNAVGGGSSAPIASGRTPMRYRSTVGALALAAVVGTAILGARADAEAKYPVRPITMIVPFPAGGGVDAVARIVADKLGAALGQQIVIDNRGGAAGVIGMRVGAKAAPDGYTLIIAHTGTTSINPSLYQQPGYDPRRDFAPIGLISSTPIVLMAHPAFPAKSLAELIALAKKEPGKLNVGTPPPGTGGYLAAELFKAVAQVEVTIVPFKGTAQLTNDLVGGHVPIEIGRAHV